MSTREAGIKYKVPRSEPCASSSLHFSDPNIESCASSSLQFSDLNIDVNGNDTNVIILEGKEDINCLENIDLDMMIPFGEENAIDENHCQIIDLSVKKTNMVKDDRQILLEISNENAIRTKIMSLFDKLLTYPDNILKKERKKAKVVSTAITSDQWQQQKFAQEQQKQQKQREIAEKKKKRELLKIQKEKEKRIKQAAIEEKRKINNEIKKLIFKKKNIK